jgi:hypothetical protein
MRRILLCLLLSILAIPAFAAKDERINFYAPTWGDSSGRDGKGGVSIVTVGDTHKFLVRPGDGPGEPDDDTADRHADWIVYSEIDSCLSYEFTWVTTDKDKFWGRCWAGGGIAFNNSWSSIDVSTAKYLVFDAKSDPEGLDMTVGLAGETDSSASGSVKISDFAEKRRLGREWTRVIIPFTSIPDLARIDLTKVKMLRFDLLQGFPENKPCAVYLDNVYFSAADIVTPVENLGWLAGPDGVVITWDKAANEKVSAFQVTVDGRSTARVAPHLRRTTLPLSLIGDKPRVVGVAATDGRKSSAVMSVTVTGGASPAKAAKVAVSGKPGRAISPWVYGVNYMSGGSLKKLGATLNRMGGNATTSYNWKDDADNRGMDWYFLNVGYAPKGAPEKEKLYHKTTLESFGAGAQQMLTIPLIGWVAKAPGKDEKLGSFPASLFPNQEANDGGCGNGRLKDGKLVWGNDPNTNYIKSDPAFMKEWVQTAVKEFGPADKGGVKFWSMDNETGLWHWNHRDVCPDGIGYDDLVDLTAKYAKAVKEADPGAQTLGMVSWGIMELAGSCWDYVPGGRKNIRIKDEKGTTGEKWTDRKAHGDITQAEFFLREMNKRSKAAGVRLIDYFDNHGFSEVWGRNAKGEKVNVMGDHPYDPVMTPQQFEGLRVLWDDTFVSPDSWCYADGNAPYLWTPWVGLIPKLRKIIDQHYPGTKLAVSEYYPASGSHYHGGLLLAVQLGIYIREGMDLACDWGGAREGTYVFLGHQLYSNYDGKGSKVLGTYADCTSSDPDLYAFGAKDGAKNLVMLVNRNHDQAIDTDVSLPAGVTTYTTYLLAETLGKRIFPSVPQAVSGTSFRVRVPAFSAMLLVAQ